MIYDIFTIARKELKEILVQRGSLRGGITNILIVVGVIGILFPMQYGVEWLTNPLGLITVAWLPLMMTMGLVADSFAGERERHTLETLLASRLSDQAILFGKITAAVAYSMIFVAAGILLGALTINLQHPGAGFYPLANLLGAVIFSLLGSLLIAGIGIQVSLHASNVRQAYQRMSIGFILIWLPIIIGPQVMPEAWILQIALWLENINIRQVVIAAGVALVAIDAGLIALNIARFHRDQLILD